jgi:hypothetical protein
MTGSGSSAIINPRVAPQREGLLMDMRHAEEILVIVDRYGVHLNLITTTS